MPVFITTSTALQSMMIVYCVVTTVEMVITTLFNFDFLRAAILGPSP
jgi:hypothetical protein